MGVFDKFKSVVLTTYEVDTKPMKKGLKDLKGAQKEQADAAEAAAEKQDAASKAQVAMLGKVAVAATAVVGAYKLAQVGLEAYEKRSRLAASTVGVDLKGLQSATKGLVSETRLLEFASKAMNGTFKLSQAQMEQAVTGALALRKTLGVDLQKALEVTQKSITEGTTEPLKELGLVVKDVENDTREGLNAALKELAEQAKLAGPDLRIPGDEMAESQVKMADAVEDLKISLGNLATALAPVLASLAELVGLLAQASSFLFEGDNLFETAQKAAFDKSFIGKAINPIVAQRETAAKLVAGARSAGRFLNTPLGGSAPANSNTPRGRRGSGGGYTLSNSAILGNGLDGGGYTGANSSGHGALAASTREALAARQSIAGVTDGLAELEQQRQAFWQGKADSAAAAEAGIFAGIFGTPTEINETAMALSALAQGFDGFAGAFGSGVDALITGSESFASAFKNAIGESLRAMAVDMSIRAFREAAMGIGQLALGNVASAAVHGKAAAMYGAGAVAAGVGARLLGAGQAASVGSVPSTSGSAGVGSASPANGNENGSSTIIVLGDDYGSRSARERESLIRETMRGAGISATGDFVVNG